MKKLFSVLLLVGLLLNVSTVYGRAVEDDVPNPIKVPAKVRKFVEIRKSEIKERITEIKATKSATVTTLKRQRISAHWKRLKTRILALIAREEKLIGRMNSRIAKIEADDKNTDLNAIKAALVSDQTKLDKAKADLQAADSSVNDVLNSSDPKEAFKAIRDTVYDIRKAIIDVHVSLAQMIGELKGLRVGQNKITPTGKV